MQYRALLATTIILSMSFCLTSLGWGMTDDMKKPCVDCHTMHNKQVGEDVYASGPMGALLNNSCYGCHTGTNQTALIWAAAPHRPFVNDTVMPEYLDTGTEPGIRNTLAGGNFYWVGINDSNGHNVEGLDTQTVRQPPGGTKWFNDTTTPLTCAGENGCHGLNLPGISEIKSMYQSHHTDAPAPLDGLTIATSYRFLKDIVGTEDEDWELSVSSGDHNQYQAGSADSTTISALCARCHVDFHSALGSPSPWFRHPVEYDLNGLPGEYTGYGGAGTYVVQTPLGSNTAATAVVSNVFSLAGEAIITCITCHRAHGSRYPFSLRWDYQSWPAGGYNGCGDCHTAKD